MFIVYGLPRSRTFWLSKFLSYGEWHCGHEELPRCRSLEDVQSWLSQPCTGTAETAAAAWWRLVPDGVKQVIVRRAPDQVIESLVRLGFDHDAMARLVTRLDKKLDQIEARVPGVVSVTFDSLGTEDGARRVFEACLPYQFDRAWWERLNAINLQTPVVPMLRYMQAHKLQIERLIIAGKTSTFATIARRAPADIDGMTFQQEPFHKFYADSEALFEGHAGRTGRGDYRTQNIPMFKMLNQMGTLQITTARCNGRLFGYVMMSITPSMDDPDKIAAAHVTTYASPDMPGLGRKIMRHAHEALRDRGVSEVLYRVGNEQPGLSALYRRIGATHRGEEYILGLN